MKHNVTKLENDFINGKIIAFSVLYETMDCAIIYRKADNNQWKKTKYFDITEETVLDNDNCKKSFIRKLLKDNTNNLLDVDGNPCTLEILYVENSNPVTENEKIDDLGHYVEARINVLEEKIDNLSTMIACLINK